MKTKSTKRALIMSVLSLIVCISMLIGTTFAWFTDSVTSGNNIIKSGNLDISLEYWNGSDWLDVKDRTDLFDQEALWEPGYTEVVYLKLENEGSLALKYQLGVNIEAEKEGVNKAGDTFKLSDYIYFDIAKMDTFAEFENREAAMRYATERTKISEGYAESDYLEAKAAPVYLAMVVYMPTSVENDANHNGTDIPKIELGVNVFATQYTSEEDSFDKNYDKGAPWTGAVDIDWYLDDPDADTFNIGSAEELAGLAAIVNGTATAPAVTFAAQADATVKDDFKGKTINLTSDINLRNIPWTPIGDNDNCFQGNFDGMNHTIYNLNVANSGWAGVIGHAGKNLSGGVTVKNLNVVGAEITSNRMAGAIIGQIYGSIDNCHVTDAKITVVPNKDGDKYDNGDKVGGIVGWLGDNNNYNSITNCSATNVTLKAYRDVGGIVGYVAYSTTVSGNSVKTVNVTVDQTTNYYGDKDFNSGAIYGRTSGWITESNNTVSGENVVQNKYEKDDMILVKNGLTNEVTMYLVPADYQNTTVNVPDGVTNIGGYAFAYNKNIESIVLPFTVKTLNDRAFRDTSASTVVLNEGLTNISYQAFRNASNVTSVVIPSTVTTISKEAFQNSGITSLVVPASVSNIEYGGLRDMKQLTSVTIEGNVNIPVYAFRACTNLRTVILKGDDVNFNARGMIFTNKENGDGSAITVYVANETVKERLLASDTAAKDYGGYKIVVLGTDNKLVADGLYKDNEANTYYVADANGLATLNNMMSNKTAGKDVVVNLWSSIDMSGKTWTPVDSHADTAFTIKEINGNGNTISNLTVNGQAMFTRFAGTGNVTVKDITFDNASINSNGNINTSILTVHSYQNVLLDNVDVKNSTIIGGYKVAPLIATVYNESSSTVTATLKNCDVENVTVKATAYDFCTAGMVAFVYAGDNDKIEFENCTVSNVKLYAPNDSYKAHAAIYTTGSESLFNEAKGVTVTNVTFANN